jgi:hypothetical protein
MSETTNESGGTGPSHRSVEIGVAVAMAGLALIGIFGSLKVGAGWGAEGPQAGFFPFYICLLVVVSCAVNLAQIFMSENDGELFAAWRQLRQVLAVVVPTAVYVLIIPYIGMYVASALLVFTFMKFLGRYSWMTALPAALVVPLLAFAMFEIWFLVPLPKGPLESFLGY